MAKDKVVKDEVLEPEQVTDIAKPEDVMSFLNRTAEQDYEPSFTQILINHNSATFTSPGFGGGDELSAIVLVAPKIRAFWTSDEDEEAGEYFGGLPICSSRGKNAIDGLGELTRVIENDAPDIVRALVSPIMEVDYSCDNCKWAEFGSIPGQRGQACKQCYRLLLFNPDSGVAGLLSVPPTSLSAWRDYKAGIPKGHYSTVITKISLNAMSEGKYHWSTLKFSLSGEITPDAMQKLGKKILYKGQNVFEAQALIAEFLQLPIDKDVDYPDVDEGVGDDF